MKRKLLMFFLILLFAASGTAQTGAILDTRDEYWIYMEGPEANEELGKDYPIVLEGPTEYEDSCWFNGTIYREGEIKDMGEKIQNSTGTPLTFETGGWHSDAEICLNIPGRGDDVSSGENRRSDNYRGGDKGGEWWDQDQWIVTRFLRNNGGSVHSDAWQELWVEQPDSAAAPSTGVIPGAGIAMEDDCEEGYNCEDIRGGTGRDGPYAATFIEGALDDDNALDVETPFSIQSLSMFHNRVQAGNGTRHPDGSQGPGNAQDQENPSTENLDEMPLENSHIDPLDDEWALTSKLDRAIANDGTPYPPGGCYGAQREQGVDKTKIQAVYANSYANASDVYNQGKSAVSDFTPYFSTQETAEQHADDGNWINPDRDRRSVTEGGYSCDLTGKDWGYAYRDTTCMNNDPPEASFLITSTWTRVTAESTAEDPDQNIVLREWDWTSDGDIEDTGETASNSYGSDGTYTITHNVTDECGAYDVATRQVTVTAGVPEGGGSIASISFPDPSGERSIIPARDSDGNYEDMCIGEGCTHETGQGPTSYDANEYVNLSSDNMSGTLKTSTVEFPEGENLCIGQGCAWGAGNANGLLGGDGSAMDGSLKTSGLPTSNNQCIGAGC
jgi:hypothetical protein